MNKNAVIFIVCNALSFCVSMLGAMKAVPIDHSAQENPNQTPTKKKESDKSYPAAHFFYPNSGQLFFRQNSLSYSVKNFAGMCTLKCYSTNNSTDITAFICPYNEDQQETDKIQIQQLTSSEYKELKKNFKWSFTILIPDKYYTISDIYYNDVSIRNNNNVSIPDKPNNTQHVSPVSIAAGLAFCFFVASILYHIVVFQKK